MKSFILTLLIGFNLTLLSQVPVSSGSYFQDFGTVDITSWTNNTTFLGWYEAGTFQSHLNITTAAPTNTGGFYTYECNGNNDQKIGSRASGGSGTLRYGVVLQNTTGSAVSNVQVSYKGYQLSLAQNGAVNTIAFDYIVSTTPPAITAGGGTAVSALNFTQLQSNGSSGSAQVAGYPCTQMVDISNCITVSIPNNSYILLRWTDVDDAGNDHHMAIDDVNIQFLSTNLTVNSSVICAAQNTTLTATGAASYTWSPATALSATTGSAVTANPSSTTVYTISGSVGSCPLKTITSTVTVNPNPSVTVNSQTICSSTSATLTATGAFTYTWSPATGLSATTGSVVVANPGSTTVYTITGNSGACAVTPGTSTVTVLSSPTLAPVSSQTICSSGSATLTTSGATNYTWSPNTAISSTTGNSVTANPIATTVYTLDGDNGVCPALPVTFTISVIATPTLSINSATICASGTTTLTAMGASNYTWTPATSLSSGTGSIVTSNPSGTTIYTINGSVASCSATPVTATVTVLPNPVISVNSGSICASGSITLTASGAANYTWSPSATLSSSTGISVTASPTTVTVYTITGSNGSCPVTPATATVTIVSNPVITVNSSTICSSNSTNLIATGTTSYSWSPNTGLSSTTGNTVTANPSSTIVYTLTGSNGACIATPVTATVTVIQLPNLSVSSTSLCASGSAILTVSGAGSYNWAPSIDLSAATGSIVVATPMSTTIYTVTGFINTCSVTATSTLTVIPVQSAGFNYPSAHYCQASFSNPLPVITGVSGGSFSVLPSGLSVNTTNGLINLASSTQNTYTVSYTTGGVCGETQSFVLSVNTTPSITVSSHSVCEGEAALLTATPSLAGGTYHWLPGNQSTSVISVSPATTSTYVVTYTLNNCSVFETTIVNVSPKPVASVNPSSTSITEGDDVLLVATGGSNYVWNNGNTNESIHVQPKETTDYCVDVTNTSGCKNSVCVTIQVDKESTLYLPNVFTPNGDGLNDLFKIPNTNITEFNIKIFNRWGELLFESNAIDTGWDGTYKGKAVTDGVYVYTLTATGTNKVNYEKRGHVTVLR